MVRANNAMEGTDTQLKNREVAATAALRAARSGTEANTS